MKIRFLKNVVVDVETIDIESRSLEIYDKTFLRWQEVRINDIYSVGKFATIRLDNGDLAINVPLDSFEQLKDKKSIVTL